MTNEQLQELSDDIADQLRLICSPPEAFGVLLSTFARLICESSPADGITVSQMRETMIAAFSQRLPEFIKAHDGPTPMDPRV